MEVKNVLFKLPKNSLLLGVLFSLKEVSLLDCVNLHSIINKKFGVEVDFNYSEPFDEQLFVCRLGKYSLRGGRNIKKCLEDVYQEFPDENLLMAYKQAIEDFKKQNNKRG